jgi:hypothetical protein
MSRGDKMKTKRFGLTMTRTQASRIDKIRKQARRDMDAFELNHGTLEALQFANECMKSCTCGSVEKTAKRLRKLKVR